MNRSIGETTRALALTAAFAGAAAPETAQAGAPVPPNSLAKVVRLIDAQSGLAPQGTRVTYSKHLPKGEQAVVTISSATKTGIKPDPATMYGLDVSVYGPHKGKITSHTRPLVDFSFARAPNGSTWDANRNVKDPSASRSIFGMEEIGQRLVLTGIATTGNNVYHQTLEHNSHAATMVLQHLGSQALTIATDILKNRAVSPAQFLH